MSRWKNKRKRWLDRHSQLGNKKRKTSNTTIHRGSGSTASIVERPRYNDNSRSVVLTPPTVFSLINNPEETVDFFVKFAKVIEKKEHGKDFFIDSSKVENVTVDALIYLVAILQNDTVNRTMGYSFSGNYPTNEEANRVYTESGFNDYVQSRMRKLPPSSDKKCIVCGINNQSAVSKDLCDLVMTSLGKTLREIQPLQKVLIELMSNVYYHAYDKNPFMAKKWYMYGEHVDDHVRCVFVDTGQGIARTVKKNFSEKIIRLFGRGANDSKLIQSTFMGEFRTATNEKHRGNGLSSVRKNIETDLFESFEVFSGRGRCVFPKDKSDNEMITVNYQKPLYGTLFTFVIK